MKNRQQQMRNNKGSSGGSGKPTWIPNSAARASAFSYIHFMCSSQSAVGGEELLGVVKG